MFNVITSFGTEISFAIAVTIACGLFLWACKRGVVPEPVSSRALEIAAFVFTLGLLPLLRVLFTRTIPERKQPPAIVREKAPEPDEVEATNKRVENATQDTRDIQDKLDAIDAAEALARGLAGDDSGAGDLARERLRRLQGKP